MEVAIDSFSTQVNGEGLAIVGDMLELGEISKNEHQQIADKLGCPVGTVMSRIYYARKKMRKELGVIKNELAI